MDRGELEGLDREALVVQAQAAGIRRARILTRPELIDELLRLDPAATDASLRKSRGFFGRARDLVARVVERGLHLPDAAERILAAAGELPQPAPRIEPQAMPTVTLAEIYAAQGHRQRAVETVRRVLEREPEHTAARALLMRLEDETYIVPAPPLPPEPEIEPALHAEMEDEEAEGEPEALEPEALEPEALAAEALEPETLEPESLEPETLEPETLAPETLAEHAPPPPSPEAPLEAAAPSLDEEPDECFAIPLPAEGEPALGATYVRWRVSPSAIGEQLEARPNGHFVVRVHLVVPSWEGPLAETRDRRIDPDAGEATLSGLPEPAVVRVAVGWLDDDEFTPLAHSPALESPQGRGLAIWTPSGSMPVVLDDPRAASLARAFEAARSVVEARG